MARWNRKWIVHSPGSLANNSPSGDYAISADGNTIVGEADGSFAEAFKTGPSGLIGLGDIPGGATASAAHGVSADGSVIVGEGRSRRGTEAFIWTEQLGMRSLQEYAASRGASLTGWQLTFADDVSDNGKVIVGQGINPDGQTEAWVLFIPEPHTGMLVLSATAMLLACRGRSTVSSLLELPYLIPRVTPCLPKLVYLAKRAAVTTLFARLNAFAKRRIADHGISGFGLPQPKRPFILRRFAFLVRRPRLSTEKSQMRFSKVYAVAFVFLSLLAVAIAPAHAVTVYVTGNSNQFGSFDLATRVYTQISTHSAGRLPDWRITTASCMEFSTTACCGRSAPQAW